MYFQRFWIIILLEQVVKGTLAGLFVMINSLLLIVVNNPARIDFKNPFGIIDLSNTLRLFYICPPTSIYEFHIRSFLCQLVTPLVLSWVEKITKAMDGRTSKILTQKKTRENMHLKDMNAKDTNKNIKCGN